MALAINAALAFNPWNIKALIDARRYTKTVRCWMKPSRISTRTSRSPGTSNDLFANQLERKTLSLCARIDSNDQKETQPNAQMDMYRIAGLGAGEEQGVESDIKKAYRNLAYHPDKPGSNMPAWSAANEF